MPTSNVKTSFASANLSLYSLMTIAVRIARKAMATVETATRNVIKIRAASSAVVISFKFGSELKLYNFTAPRPITPTNVSVTTAIKIY